MTQRGNILFLILLAVVLFAALAYAVTSSMRGGGKDATSEKVEAQAADLYQFFSQMDAAVLRLQLSNDIKPENISFEYSAPNYGGTSTSFLPNANCASTTCRVFHTDGGGMAPRRFDKAAVLAPAGWNNAWVAPGYYDLALIQWPQAGTSASDVALRVVAINPKVCEEINAAEAISTSPTLSGGFSPAHNTSLWSGSGQGFSSGASQLTGKSTFAQQVGGADHCYVWHLIFAR